MKSFSHFFTCVICLIIFTEAKAQNIASTEPPEFDKCLALSTSQPDVNLPRGSGLKCITVTNDVVTSQLTWDNIRLNATNTPVYTTFQGNVNFFNQTPKFCFDEDNNLRSFEINFNNSLTRQKVRTEITPCRAGGYWTDGQRICGPPPPECPNINIPVTADHYDEEVYVTINMKDVANLRTRRTVILTQFHGSTNPRLVYNITSNQSKLLSETEFFSACFILGPCYRGKFAGAPDLFYLFAGFPPLFLKVRRGNMSIGVRYDPRSFGLIEKGKKRPCVFRNKYNYEFCNSPVGYHSWRTIWKKSLPYHKEWLAMHWFVRWSYKGDCIINVTDTDTNEELVNYVGPCGRYYEMKLGDYPYPKVGLYVPSGLDTNMRMRYKDIRFVFHNDK